MKKRLALMLPLILFCSCNTGDGGEPNDILAKKVKTLTATYHYEEEGSSSSIYLDYNDSGRLMKFSLPKSSVEVIVNYAGNKIFYTSPAGNAVNIGEMGYYSIFHSNYRVDEIRFGSEEEFTRAIFTYENNYLSHLSRQRHQDPTPTKTYDFTWNNGCLTGVTQFDAISESESKYTIVYTEYKNNVNLDMSGWISLASVLPYPDALMLHNEFGIRSTCLPSSISCAENGYTTEESYEYTFDKSGYLKEIVCKVKENGEFATISTVTISYE